MSVGWLSTQIKTSLSIGVVSLFLFTLVRRKFVAFYTPAPAVPAAWLGRGVLGWIRPLWAIDEAKHASAIGIDGLALLDFIRTSTVIFAGVSLWSLVIVIPTNWLKYGTMDGVPPDQDANSTAHASPTLFSSADAFMEANLMGATAANQLAMYSPGPLPIKPDPDFPAPQKFNVVHVVTEIAITIWVLYILFRASRRVSRMHQEYNVHVATQGARVATLPGRTVEIRQIPTASYNIPSLRSLFNQMGFPVENLSFVLDPTPLQWALAQRVWAQSRLELAWNSFLKNRYAADPSGPHPGPAVQNCDYDPEQILAALEKDWHTYSRTAPQIRDPESGPVSIRPSSEQDDNEEEEAGSGEGERDSLLRTHETAEPDAETTHTSPTTTTPSNGASFRSRNANGTSTDAVLHLLAQPLYISRKRPWGRAMWWNVLSPYVDTLPHLQLLFFHAHAKVLHERKRILDPTPVFSPTTRQKRKAGTGVAFVSFYRASDAQVLAQTLYASEPGTFLTRLAAGPGEVVWSNMNMGILSQQTRRLFVSLLVFLILVFYIPPLVALLSLVSEVPLEKYIPGLSNFLKQHPQLKALFQNAFPSLVLVSWNAMLPMLFESLAYVQGARDSAQVQITVLERYHNYLLVSVVFIALITVSMWALLAELAENPAGFLSHLGSVLPIARNFSTSYVIFQALGLVPLQLLCVPTACRAIWHHLTIRDGKPKPATREPLLPGTIYPQALIVFTLATLYANVAPRITFFATAYFALLYGVIKYKLLFMHASAASASSPLAPPPRRAGLDEDAAAATPEANTSEEDALAEARAWSTGSGRIHVIAVGRCIWALVLYQTFQLSQLLVRRQTLLALVHIPLLLCTGLAWRYFSQLVSPTERFTNLAALKDAESSGPLIDSPPPGANAVPGTASIIPSLTAEGSSDVFLQGTPESETFNHPNYTLTLYRHPALDESSALPRLRLPNRAAELSD